MTAEQIEGSNVPPEEQPGDGQVLEELQNLGQQLATAVRSLWESEESRKLRQQIGDGVVRLGQQIESAVESAQDSDAVRKLGSQAKESVDRARESDVVSRLEQSLISGLQELNRQVSKLVDSMESRAPQASGPTDGHEGSSQTEPKQPPAIDGPLDHAAA